LGTEEKRGSDLNADLMLLQSILQSDVSRLVQEDTSPDDLRSCGERNFRASFPDFASDIDLLIWTHSCAF